MNTISRERTLSEQAFAAWVEDLTARGVRADAGGAGQGAGDRREVAEPRTDDASVARARLVALLRADHAVYKQRSASAVARMRGWVLLALEQLGVREPELLFVLEELDNACDPYVVATAARALRTFKYPTPSFVSAVEGALERVRYRDYPVNMRQYGGEGFPGIGTTAADELECTLNWLCGRASVAVAAKPRPPSAVRSTGPI
jgi:hypothetical protein